MRILLADDHPIFRKGMKEVVLSEIPNIIFEEAGNGAEALAKIQSFFPEIIILDIEMPDKDGIQVCQEAKQLNPKLKVIILTMFKSAEIFNLALRSGADGYILKDNSAQEIADCIKAIQRGEQYISSIMRQYLNEIDKLRSEYRDIASGLMDLTTTEKKVLRLIAENFSSREIADKLFVTPKSVDNYRYRICKKLGLKHENNSLIKWIFEKSDLVKLLSV